MQDHLQDHRYLPGGARTGKPRHVQHHPPSATGTDSHPVQFALLPLLLWEEGMGEHHASCRDHRHCKQHSDDAQQRATSEHRE